MALEQRQFFDELRDAWAAGRVTPVDGNISYLFCLAYELINERDLSEAADQLLRLASAYVSEDKVADYCRGWAADCYVALADWENALKVFPPIALDCRATMQTDRLLTIKVNVEAPLAARDVITLFGPKVTAYAKGHLENVAKYLEIQLGELERRSGDTLRCWTADPRTLRHPVPLFSGVPIQRAIVAPQGYGFSYSPDIEAFCTSLTREAENTLREDAGIPRVGEGWVEETRLFYALRDALVGHEVLQHARIDWLGQQHLDVFVPALRVAVEYQGEQHERPIEFFGGAEAFAKVQERDARKRRLCKKNAVHLIEVKPGYDLDAVVSLIRSVERGT